MKATQSSSPFYRVISRILPAALLLLAFGLRLHRLGAESLWYDETVSVYLARLPVPAMLAHTAGDIHPPGYYLLLHLWSRLANPTLAHGLEFLYAWPSLCFGTITAALVYALGRRLLGPQVALLALLFAALDPFQTWYSQEVRMYTVGAALGLLAFWATLKMLSAARAWPWLIVYLLAAAAGLYTLYYFAFVLIALNVVALYWLWQIAPGAEQRRRLWLWLLAQAGVVILWLPWLPVFWRQAVDPPVPSWRTPWVEPISFAASMGDAFAAFVVGQSAPMATAWPWALLVVALGAAFAVRQRRRAGLTVLLYVALPLLLIVGLSLFVTPIYHVRYLSFVAAPFAIVSAGVAVDLWQWRRWAGAALVGLLVAGAGASLTEFWTNPTYAADDHRGALAALAERWRPGDAILANAGWIYPVLTTYWPAATTAAASTPPPLQQIARLDAAATADPAPVIVRTGSVDGDPGLGWGDPGSDFYALSSAATVAGLQTIMEQHPRLWHYRLYDTVNDPDGVIRDWLAGNADLLQEQQIPGRDFGLVQLFASRAFSPTVGTAAWAEDGAVFGGALRLARVTAPTVHRAGENLYVNIAWEPLAGLASIAADLSTSLRLYAADGSLVAQHDEGALPPTGAWRSGESRVQALAVPVPGATPPGAYSLELVVYRQDNGEPLAVPESERSVYGQRYRLAEITVQAQ